MTNPGTPDRSDEETKGGLSRAGQNGDYAEDDGAGPGIRGSELAKLNAGNSGKK